MPLPWTEAGMGLSLSVLCSLSCGSLVAGLGESAGLAPQSVCFFQHSNTFVMKLLNRRNSSLKM